MDEKEYQELEEFYGVASSADPANIKGLGKVRFRGSYKFKEWGSKEFKIGDLFWESDRRRFILIKQIQRGASSRRDWYIYEAYALEAIGHNPIIAPSEIEKVELLDFDVSSDPTRSHGEVGTEVDEKGNVTGYYPRVLKK